MNRRFKIKYKKKGNIKMATAKKKDGKSKPGMKLLVATYPSKSSDECTLEVKAITTPDKKDSKIVFRLSRSTESEESMVQPDYSAKAIFTLPDHLKNKPVVEVTAHFDDSPECIYREVIDLEVKDKKGELNPDWLDFRGDKIEKGRYSLFLRVEDPNSKPVKGLEFRIMAEDGRFLFLDSDRETGRYFWNFTREEIPAIDMETNAMGMFPRSAEVHFSERYLKLRFVATAINFRREDKGQPTPPKIIILEGPLKKKVDYWYQDNNIRCIYWWVIVFLGGAGLIGFKVQSAFMWFGWCLLLLGAVVYIPIAFSDELVVAIIAIRRSISGDQSEFRHDYANRPESGNLSKVGKTVAEAGLSGLGGAVTGLISDLFKFKIFKKII